MFKAASKLALCAAVLAASVGFCAQSQAAGKTIKVGTEPTFAPFEFLDKNASPVGYDIDIINAIGKAEGVEVTIVKMPFDGLIPAMITSQIDAAISGITITDERKKKVDFSDPYYDSGLSAVILTENKDKFKKLSDLKSSKICGQIGNTGVDYAKKLSGKVTAFNTHPEAYMELKNHGCDAVMTDKPVNEYFLSKQQGSTYTEINDYAEAAQFGIAVKKGSDVLALVNDGLKKIKADGTFDKIHAKWFKSAE
jgi:glutamine transport system substrate-binding protein